MPGDTEGLFVPAVYHAAIINLGYLPYDDPNYYAKGDIPEMCNIENAAMTALATLAAAATIDRDF